jgi:hypothetical protein
MPSLKIVEPSVNEAPPFDWRSILHVHPAALDYPALSDPERKALADDIRDNGLRITPVVWSATETGEPALLDGVHRLDALASLGLIYETEGQIYLRTWTGTVWAELSGAKIKLRRIDGGDPYVHAASYNAHRRHLNAEKKRELIDKLLKADPTKSDRQIGKVVKADNKTVASRRKRAETREEIPHVEKHKDSKGCAQPAKKPPKKIAKSAPVAEKPVVSPDDIALREFDGHILRLLQMTGKAKPDRFAKSGVPPDDLVRVGEFLVKVAAVKRVRAS